MRLAKTDSVANGTVSADRVSQPTLATAPVPLQAANPVPPPRIMDQVRAALRAEPRPPGPASAAPTITVLVRPAAPTTATASDKLSSERSKAIGKEAVPESKGPTKTAVRKEHRVVVTRAEPAHVAAQPHQHRTRIAQAYAPPVYLGRVKVQYAPPMPLFVLGGGGSYGGGAVRRTQFNSASMWDTLKRQGM